MFRPTFSVRLIHSGLRTVEKIRVIAALAKLH